MNRQIRTYFILLVWLLIPSDLLSQNFSFSAFARKDMLLLRDGSELYGKIELVNNENTIIKDGKESKTLPNEEIYMIKYAKRGNVFFTERGERITGVGDGKIPAGATAIYMLEGEECVGYDVAIDPQFVTYKTKKGKNGQLMSVRKELVFLIKYPDDTKEILNDFLLIQLAKKEAALQAAEEQRLVQLKQTFPREVTFKLKNGNVIEAILLTEEPYRFTYKQKDLKNGPVFGLDKSNLEEIIEK